MAAGLYFAALVTDLLGLIWLAPKSRMLAEILFWFPLAPLLLAALGLLRALRHEPWFDPSASASAIGPGRRKWRGFAPKCRSGQSLVAAVRPCCGISGFGNTTNLAVLFGATAGARRDRAVGHSPDFRRYLPACHCPADRDSVAIGSGLCGVRIFYTTRSCRTKGVAQVCRCTNEVGKSGRRLPVATWRPKRTTMLSSYSHSIVPGGLLVMS